MIQRASAIMVHSSLDSFFFFFHLIGALFYCTFIHRKIVESTQHEREKNYLTKNFK